MLRRFVCEIDLWDEQRNKNLLGAPSTKQNKFLQSVALGIKQQLWRHLCERHAISCRIGAAPCKGGGTIWLLTICSSEDNDGHHDVQKSVEGQPVLCTTVARLNRRNKLNLLKRQTAIAVRTGKKWPQLAPPSHGPSPRGVVFFFPSNAFMAFARSFNTLNGIAKAVVSN